MTYKTILYHNIIDHNATIYNIIRSYSVPAADVMRERRRRHERMRTLACTVNAHMHTYKHIYISNNYIRGKCAHACIECCMAYCVCISA